MYVALENGGATQAIDTLTNKVIATIPIGQTSQALVYVPDAAPSEGAENLEPLGEVRETNRIRMIAPHDSPLPRARATVGVDSQGILDLLEIAASGLQPKTDYILYLVDSPRAPFREKVKLAMLTTMMDGAAIAQAIGPLKHVVTSDDDGEQDHPKRYLLVTPLGSNTPVLVQALGEFENGRRE